MPACRAAFEFRHPSWFSEDVFELLRDHQAALCVADADDGLDVPFVATADWGTCASAVRLRRIGRCGSGQPASGGRAGGSASPFFKHEDSGTGPRLAARLLELLGEGAGPRARAA
jgi:hypothetical protein